MTFATTCLQNGSTVAFSMRFTQNLEWIGQMKLAIYDKRVPQAYWLFNTHFRSDFQIKIDCIGDSVIS